MEERRHMRRRHMRRRKRNRGVGIERSEERSAGDRSRHDEAGVARRGD